MSEQLGDARFQKDAARAVHFMIEYARIYFDVFGLKDNRGESWPIFFSLYLKFNDEPVEYSPFANDFRKRYLATINDFVLKSRIKALSESGYILIDADLHDNIRSATLLTSSEKLRLAMEKMALELINLCLDRIDLSELTPNQLRSINSMIHDGMMEYGKSWIVLVESLVEMASVKMSHREKMNRTEEMIIEDEYWLTLFCSWAHMLSVCSSAEAYSEVDFEYDDLNRWLNRKSAVSVDASRKVLGSLSRDMPVFVVDASVRPNKYRMSRAAIELMEKHTIDVIETVESVRSAMMTQVAMPRLKVVS